MTFICLSPAYRHSHVFHCRPDSIKNGQEIRTEHFCRLLQWPPISLKILLRLLPNSPKSHTLPLKKTVPKVMGEQFEVINGSIDLTHAIYEQWDIPAVSSRAERTMKYFSHASPAFGFPPENGKLHWSNGHLPSHQWEETAKPAEEEGLSLLTLLLECAVAISVENLPEANRILLELTQLASPYGASCGERLVAYFAQAMASRVMNTWLGVCAPLVSHRSILAAFQAFNNVSPAVKFAHFTSNQAILEALHKRERLHIVDVDIMQGLQWPPLFHLLATRGGAPPRIRMTAFSACSETLAETGRQLSAFARRLGITFEFHPVVGKIGEAAAAVEPLRGEAVAVQWVQHALYDATGADEEALRSVQRLRPRVVALVEQEVAQGGPFLERFVAALHYYSTAFDALGGTVAVEDGGRQRVEQGLLGREMANILAVGGPARSGGEKFRRWRAELPQRGFAQVAMSGNALAQAQLILNMFPTCDGYRVFHGDGTMRLGWKDVSLYTASAWTSQHFPAI